MVTPNPSPAPKSATPDTTPPALAARARAGRTRAVDIESVLLEAAHHLLETEGPDALTVRRVATEAGVAPMSLYHRFGGKDGLIEAIFVDGFARLTEALLEHPAGDPIAELEAGCANYRRYALAHPALYSVMFERAIPSFAPPPSAQMTCGGSFNVLVNGVLRAQAAGRVGPGDAVDLAQQLWDACHGAISLELRGLGFASDRAAHYDALIATLLAGLAPR